VYEVFVCECEAQQQAMHLARLHQKQSSLAAAAAASSITQSTQTAADATSVSAPSALARPNNAALTGTLEMLLLFTNLLVKLSHPQMIVSKCFSIAV